MQLKPDPTFYASPKDAMKAPPETLAYVALLSASGNGVPDRLAVVDTDPSSPGYGTEVGGVDLPNSGDELHHFGWNACSAALCPFAPHPHVERRYLIVPGLRSSRIYVIDTKPNPAQPHISKIIEPEEIVAKTGYTRPHTVHCGPDAIYVSALGNADGDGPGGIFKLDCDTFDVIGPWEADRGPQYLAYDFWWHLTHDVLISSEWGTPKMLENGLNAEMLLAGKYGHNLHFWDLRTRKHKQSIDLGPEQQMVLELRPSHDPANTYGFAGVVVSLKDLSSSIWLWHRKNGEWAAQKVIEIPGRAGRSGPAARSAQRILRRAAAAERHRSLRRRPLSLRVVLGNRRDAPVRRQRSLQSETHRLGAYRRHRPPRAASGESR